MGKIILGERFKEEICTFEMAKKVAKAGLTLSNNYFAYDNNGEVGDGGWMIDLGYKDLFPCVQFPFAATMVANLEKIRFEEIQIYKNEDGYYTLAYEDINYHDKNMVDLLLAFWLLHK